jgi:hypothetical protein
MEVSVSKSVNNVTNFNDYVILSATEGGIFTPFGEGNKSLFANELPALFKSNSFTKTSFYEIFNHKFSHSHSYPGAGDAHRLPVIQWKNGCSQ